MDCGDAKDISYRSSRQILRGATIQTVKTCAGGDRAYLSVSIYLAPLSLAIIQKGALLSTALMSAERSSPVKDTLKG